jgi:hypothetical protein
MGRVTGINKRSPQKIIYRELRMACSGELRLTFTLASTFSSKN